MAGRESRKTLVDCAKRWLQKLVSGRMRDGRDDGSRKSRDPSWIRRYLFVGESTRDNAGSERCCRGYWEAVG